MEYHGKLYGKVGNKYFDTGSTSEDFDALQQKVDELAEQVLKFNLDSVSVSACKCGICGYLITDIICTACDHKIDAELH
jgi:hypothetical protein